MPEMTESLQFKLVIDQSQAVRGLKDVKKHGLGVGADLDKEFRKVATSTKKAATEIGKAASAVKVLSPTIGKLGSTIKNSMTSPLTAGAVAMTALGVGAVVLAGKLLELMGNIEELHDELRSFSDVEGFLPPVDATTIQSIKEAQAAMDGAGLAMKGLALTALTEFAPAITNGATIVIAFTLAVSDMARQMFKAIEAIGKWYSKLTPMERMAVKVISPLADSIAATATSLHGLNQAFIDSDGPAGSYMARAREITGELAKMNGAAKDATGAVEEMEIVFQLHAQAGTSTWRAEFEAEAEALEAKKAAEQEYFDWVVAEAERTAARREAIAFSLASSTGAIFGKLSSIMATEAEKATDTSIKEAQRRFEISQALAVAEVMINTAAAVMRTMREWPMPAGLAMAAPVMAMGALQLAAISQAEPPTAHMGASGLAPDEMMRGGRRILQNEAVIDTATTRRIGPDGINALQNGAGVGGGGATQVTVSYKHLDRQFSDLMRRRSRSRTAVAGQKQARGFKGF